MYYFNHDERRYGELTPRVLRNEWFWNIWALRLKPYGVLADGDEIAIVVTSDSGSSIRYVVKARDVTSVPVASKKAAISAIVDHTGLTSAAVAANPYTAAKPDRPGHLLIWRPAKIRSCNLPRPADLRMGRHGWALSTPAPEADVVRTPDVASTVRDFGQGRINDALKRAAIEDQAMKIAKAYLAGKKFRAIKNVSRGASWDFECVDSQGVKHRVEVKGTTGAKVRCELTANEVAATSDGSGPMILIVVTSITVSPSAAGYAASGGRPHEYFPWSPQPAELKATHYSWAPASTAGRSELLSAEATAGAHV